MATEKVLKSRMFTIMQYEKNPKTGEDLFFNEDNILAGIGKKSVKEWAYILHDKDTWNEDAFEAYVDKTGEEPEWQVGDKKPRHWHVVIKVSPALTINQIAKWFSVDPNFVEVKKGHNTFLDCVEYLTHESEKQQLLGKYRYPDSEVKANFPFRMQLDKRNKDRELFGRDLDEKTRYRAMVLYKGMTIREIIEENPIAYQNDFQTLDKLRLKYISDTAPLPPTRINYYVYAEDGQNGSGIGKGLLSRALARSMYPHLENDDDIFFEVGEAPALFDGYDGQPVIIWNDRRGGQILHELGGKVGNVYNVFDTTPTSQRQNIKYSAVKLINEVNIVNSVQSFEKFIDGISGQGTGVKEDKNQALRRFPIIIPMRYEDFDILINKGYMENSDAFDQYEAYGRVRANMQQLQVAGRGNLEKIREAEATLLEPLTEKHKEFIARRQAVQDETVTVESILKGTGFIKSEKFAELKQYRYTEHCTTCGTIYERFSPDIKNKGIEQFTMFCDNCRDSFNFLEGIKDDD